MIHEATGVEMIKISFFFIIPYCSIYICYCFSKQVIVACRLFYLLYVGLRLSLLQEKSCPSCITIPDQDVASAGGIYPWAGRASAVRLLWPTVHLCLSLDFSATVTDSPRSLGTQADSLIVSATQDYWVTHILNSLKATHC